MSGVKLDSSGLETPMIKIGESQLTSSDEGKLIWNDEIIEKPDLSGYVTDSELNGKNYLTSSALTDYAKKTDLSSYVTTSALNSKGYLTSSSLSDYAKKTDLNSYATTSSLSSYIKTSTLKSYITATGQNGTSWYRKYSDGWIEQGGNFTCPADSYVKITYLSAFANTNYSLLATARNSEGDRIFAKTKNINTTYAEIGSFSSSGTFGTDISWFACGY